VPSKLSKMAVVDGVFLGRLVNAANHLLLGTPLAPKSAFRPQLCFSYYFHMRVLSDGRPTEHVL
jgi:hypothetical protein